MKKITLLLLFVATVSLAQNRVDFKQRYSSAILQADITFKKYKDELKLELPEQGYTIMKQIALQGHVEFSEAEKKEISDMFKKQFHELKQASELYTTSKNLQSKLNLIKVLIKNEEDFRKSLNVEQQVAYRRYGDTYSKSQEWIFDFNFMSDKVLSEYKEIAGQ